MRSVWAVIRREYLQRVRSRWFLFATAGVPLLMLAVAAVPMWMASGQQAAERSLVLIDRTGEIGERVAAALAEGGYRVEMGAPTGEPEAFQRVEAGEVGGYLVLDRDALTEGRARWVTVEGPSLLRQLGLRQAVVQAALEAQLAGSGTDVDVLLRGGGLEIQRLGGGDGMQDPAFAAAYVGAFVLYMVILIYAVAVMRSVLEEKTSRIVEVILSSLRPWQLMLGKILGVGAVGLTQLAVWVLAGAAIAAVGLPTLLASRPELAALAEGGELGDLLPGAGFFGWFLLFFLGGYFIYSALYAAVGAMCNSDEEAQQAQLPVMLLVLVPVLALVGVVENPHAPSSVALSLIPFFSPVLMFARAAGGAAPLWQIVLSVVLMALTVLAVAWLAGRIYKVGILMTGKRPTLRELARWVREA